MKSLKINVPEGFEVDKEKSTFEEIVFKPIVKELPKKWEDLEKISGWLVLLGSSNPYKTIDQVPTPFHRNVYYTEAQAKAAIALAQLTQLREVYRDGWQPDWTDSSQPKFVIERHKCYINSGGSYFFVNYFLSFQSAEIRDQFLENFRDLIEEASPLLFGS